MLRKIDKDRLNKYLVKFNIEYKKTNSKYSRDDVIKKVDIFYACNLNHLMNKIRKTYCCGNVASISNLEILKCIPIQKSGIDSKNIIS